MQWALVIEELERQAAFATDMSAINGLDKDVARAFGIKADLLVAISASLRMALEEEDYNGFWKQEERQRTTPAVAGGICPKAEADE